MTTTTTRYLPFIVNEAGKERVKKLPVRVAITRHERVKIWPAYEELEPEVAEQMKRQLKNSSHAAHIL